MNGPAARRRAVCLLLLPALWLAVSVAIAPTMAQASEASSSWSVETVPSPPGGGTLDAVACTSASNCVAVGYTNSSLKAWGAAWNGSAWSLVTVPSPQSEAFLVSAACLSPTDCMAAGYSDASSGVASVLVEKWNGSAWSVVTAPNPKPDSSLESISCVGMSWCIAVGAYLNKSFNPVDIAEVWNGAKWSDLPIANLGDVLSGIGCFSKSACNAVGVFGKAEHWNGHSWTKETTPKYDGHFDSVACPSKSECLATENTVGKHGSMVDRWNGKSWSPVKTPTLSNTNDLNGVVCSSAKQCEAVGEAFNGAGGAAKPMAQAWNGTAWSLQTMPAVGGSASLLAISCWHTGDCMAVGIVGTSPLSEEYSAA